MQLPPDLEQAIERAYVQMLQEPHHSLTVKQRLPIYYAMENFDPFIGKKARGWLAFLAAQKVLPIWDNEYKGSSDNGPRTNLELAEAILRGKLSLEQLEEEEHQLTLMFLGMGLGQHAWDYSDEANYAYVAPDLALAEAMGDFLYKKDSRKTIEVIERQIEEGFPDEMIIGVNVDTASLAVCAYSGISFDWDALSNKIYNENLNGNDNAPEILAYVANTFHPNFKPAKRREFWDWWLGQAISEAWKLATEAT